jgi:hypothetical protein
MATARQDPAARRRRLDLRLSVLKRRFGIASILGFGTLFGLVAQHAVGTQKHTGGATASQASTSARGTSTFFDASGPGYSFDDSGVRVAQQNAAATASQAAQTQQPAPVAQSSGS